jgi:hypothetical protein
MMYLHYDPASGAIVGWETGSSDPAGVNGSAVLALELERPPDPLLYRVDTESLAIVEMSAAEQAAASMPTTDEIKRAIFAALAASDHFMLPDRDDIAPQRLAAWIAYRKRLRNLRNLADAAAMINAWPIDPDGNDAIAHLRKRL